MKSNPSSSIAITDPKQLSTNQLFQVMKENESLAKNYTDSYCWPDILTGIDEYSWGNISIQLMDSIEKGIAHKKEINKLLFLGKVSATLYLRLNTN